MKNDLAIVAALAAILILGLGIGFMTGQLWGENKGLRAQDGNLIKALGARNAVLERDLNAANSILSKTAQIDPSVKKFIEEQIKAYQESKKGEKK